MALRRNAPVEPIRIRNVIGTGAGVLNTKSCCAKDDYSLKESESVCNARNRQSNVFGENTSKIQDIPGAFLLAQCFV